MIVIHDVHSGGKILQLALYRLLFVIHGVHSGGKILQLALNRLLFVDQAGGAILNRSDLDLEPSLCILQVQVKLAQMRLELGYFLGERLISIAHVEQDPLIDRVVQGILLQSL